MNSLLTVPSAPASPANATFSGHETFAFRFAWLKKSLDGLQSKPDLFQSEEAMQLLGVGKNMVRSMRYWGIATTVLSEEEISGSRFRRPVPSSFGKAIFGENGYDPFLEDDTTLWLIHWRLTTNPSRAFTWFWTFHRQREPEFTRDTLTSALRRTIEESSTSRLSDSSLKSDVSCFLRTYIPGKRGVLSTLEETLDCPLTSLNLLQETSEAGKYRFSTGRKAGLTPSTFAFALNEFWLERHPNVETLSLREIVHGEGSPGRAFRLNEDATLPLLDLLEEKTKGKLRFADTATTRLAVRTQFLTTEEALNYCYD